MYEFLICSLFLTTYSKVSQAVTPIKSSNDSIRQQDNHTPAPLHIALS